MRGKGNAMFEAAISEMSWNKRLWTYDFATISNLFERQSQIALQIEHILRGRNFFAHFVFPSHSLFSVFWKRFHAKHDETLEDSIFHGPQDASS